MTKEFNDVKEFNEKIINLTKTKFLNAERLEWFKTVINEELSEFVEANKNYIDAINTDKSEEELIKCKAYMIDALIDLLYYTYGRLYEISCTKEEFECMWNAVQNANMNKVKGNRGRISDDDAIKPEGWINPEQTLINFMMSKSSKIAVINECIEQCYPNIKESK